MDSETLPSIELDLATKLRDRNYRERFFFAEASAEIARQLIALRKRRGLSQKELADRAGTHQPAVSRAERADYSNWSTKTLRQLTNALDGRLRIVIDAWEDVAVEYLDNAPKPLPLSTVERNQARGRELTELASFSSAAEAALGSAQPSALNDAIQRSRGEGRPRVRGHSALQSAGGTSAWR